MATLNAAQKSKIQNGTINAATDKQQKAIQRFLTANPGHITEAVPAAIDNGDPLVILEVPLENKNDALLGNRGTIRYAFIEGTRQWVIRFVATKAESKGYRSAQRHARTLTDAEIEQEFVSLSNQENEDLIEYRGHSKTDPTGDEATFNADKDRFLSMLPEDLRKTYQMHEDGYEQWEIAEKFGIQQGTVSKRITKVMRMWREYYRA